MIFDLVDSIDYTTTNCFTHQLHKALHQVNSTIKTIALSDINRYQKPDGVICRLRQRTIYRNIKLLSDWLKDTPIVIYDQDPWEAFRDGSPFKGTYQIAMNNLNVRTFAVTTQWWSDYIISQGMPSVFVKMWVSPEYCKSTVEYSDRTIPIGFIGSLHPYRKELFEYLESRGTHVHIQSSRLSYDDYLRAISNIKCFIHSENSPITVNSMPANLNVGLWIKDIEAAARGCYSIRNKGYGSETYLSSIETVFLYDDPDEIPEIVSNIQKLEDKTRQETINRTVEYIRGSNKWLETANTLIMNI